MYSLEQRLLQKGDEGSDCRAYRRTRGMRGKGVCGESLGGTMHVVMVETTEEGWFLIFVAWKNEFHRRPAVY